MSKTSRISRSVLSLVCLIAGTSAVAHAAPKYLYFVSEYPTQGQYVAQTQVFNLNVDPLYPFMLGYGNELTCRYVSPSGTIHQFRFTGRVCTDIGEMAVTVASGKSIGSATRNYSDHKSIALKASAAEGPLSELDYIPSEASTSVLSATEYASLRDNSSRTERKRYPEFDKVVSARMVDAPGAKIPGAMTCWKRHFEAQCESR